MAVLFVLGFGSGLPLYLTGQTLQAWLISVDPDLGRAAAVPTIGLAYTLKFAWAPLLDRFQLPLLGRRRGWMLALQLALLVAIAAMGAIDPVAHPEILVGAAITVAFLSASQDIVLDAYNADLLAPAERAAGAAVYVVGYRTAMATSGAVALTLADHVAWSTIYLVMAALMMIGIAGTLFAEEPAAPAHPPLTFSEALVRPFTELWERLGPRTFALVLGFVAIYKFGDYFAQALVVAFLKTGPGFAWTEIAAIYQVLGFAGTAVGGLAAGGLVARYGMTRMLVAFGMLQATTNLLYALLALTGKSIPVFCAAVLVDNLANAMGTAAFVAFLMSVCTSAVSATQFALLTSLSSVGMRVFGRFGDDLVAAAEWTGFFLATSAMAIPGLVLAYVVPRKIR